MCGRYTLCKAEQLVFKLIEAGFDFDEFSETALVPKVVFDRRQPRYNICPTQRVPVIFDDAPRKLSEAKWGLVPFWAKDEKIGAKMTNARAETIREKPAFRAAFQKRRCLVPADGFYEWRTEKKIKIPNRFTLKSEDLFYFAGLWEQWTPPGAAEPLRTFTIITTSPNALVEPVHNRMPVILPREREAAWMARETPVEELSAMLVPYPADLMRGYEVSSRVNTASNQGPELIEPRKDFELEG